MGNKPERYWTKRQTELDHIVSDILQFDPLVIGNWYTLDKDKLMVCCSVTEQKLIDSASEASGAQIL